MPEVIELDVPLAQDAVRDRLAAVVEPVPFLGGISTPKPHVRFWGRIDAHRVALRLPEPGRNSFRAWLQGTMQSTEHGTRLSLRATGFGFVPVFLGGWLLLVGSWALRAFRRADTETAWLLIGMLAFGLWIGVVGWFIYKGQAEELEQRLRALLTAD